MTDSQLIAMATCKRRWVREHREAAERRLSRARIRYDRVQEGHDLVEIAAARLEQKWAYACVAEFGPVEP